jgi:hypothetical protein
MAFQIQFVYDYLKLSTQNHENENVRSIEQGEPRYRRYKRLNLEAVKHRTVQVSRLLL